MDAIEKSGHKDKVRVLDLCDCLICKQKMRGFVSKDAANSYWRRSRLAPTSQHPSSARSNPSHPSMAWAVPRSGWWLNMKFLPWSVLIFMFLTWSPFEGCPDERKRTVGRRVCKCIKASKTRGFLVLHVSNIYQKDPKFCKTSWYFHLPMAWGLGVILLPQWGNGLGDLVRNCVAMKSNSLAMSGCESWCEWVTCVATSRGLPQLLSALWNHSMIAGAGARMILVSCCLNSTNQDASCTHGVAVANVWVMCRVWHAQGVSTTLNSFLFSALVVQSAYLRRKA